MGAYGKMFKFGLKVLIKMQIHNWEKEQFKKLFLQEQIDRFEDRFKILEVFLQNEQHITLEGLSNLLKENGTPFELDFLFDTLRLMCHYGFASKNYFDNGDARYEHLHLGRHHDHMICTKCRKIIEFTDDEIEKLQVQIAAGKGFHILQHKMEMYGICDDCLKERQGQMLLIAAKAGETLKVKGFEGGAQMRMRLRSMGIRPGDIVTVITNQGSGQVVVAVECSRFALGRGLAQKVLVEPLGLEEAIEKTQECNFSESREN
jgi:Fur family transcriptional regulator, ferric uptake regulator